MATWSELATAVTEKCQVRDAGEGWIQLAYSWDDGRAQVLDAVLTEFAGEPLVILTSPIAGYSPGNIDYLIQNVEVGLRLTPDGQISMMHPLHIEHMSINSCLRVMSAVAEIADEIEKTVTNGGDARIPQPGESSGADFPEQDHGSGIPVITAGQWIVGRDIAPGVYRYSGYVARLDSQMGIINNDNARSGLGLIHIYPHDAYFEVSGEAVRLEDYPVYDVLANAPRDGTYLVGVDIPLGKYRIHGDGSSAYYELFDRNMQRVTNDLNNGSLILDLQRSAYAVGFSGRIERL
jgi:hypothetical protein